MFSIFATIKNQIDVRIVVSDNHKHIYYPHINIHILKHISTRHPLELGI